MQLRKFNYVSALFSGSRVIVRPFRGTFMLAFPGNEHLEIDSEKSKSDFFILRDKIVQRKPQVFAHSWFF